MKGVARLVACWSIGDEGDVTEGPPAVSEPGAAHCVHTRPFSTYLTDAAVAVCHCFSGRCSL